MMPLEKLLSMQEAADLFGGKARLMRALETGRLHFIELGTGTRSIKRFRPSDLNASLRLMAAPAEPPVYIVGFSTFVKIGYTTDLRGRLHDLEEHLPMKLKLFASFPGTVSDERKLHARFAQYRSRGEWFRRSGALADWIEGGCKP